MSLELSLLIAVIAFVALVGAAIFSLIYALIQLKQLMKTASHLEQEVVAVSAQLKPLLEHTDQTIQTIHTSVENGVAIVKNSKNITQSVAYTLQAIQDVTHNIAQKAEAKIRDERTQEQAEYTIQWAELVMEMIQLIQKGRKIN